MNLKWSSKKKVNYKRSSVECCFQRINRVPRSVAQTKNYCIISHAMRGMFPAFVFREMRKKKSAKYTLSRDKQDKKRLPFLTRDQLDINSRETLRQLLIVLVWAGDEIERSLTGNSDKNCRDQHTNRFVCTSLVWPQTFVFLRGIFFFLWVVISPMVTITADRLIPRFLKSQCLAWKHFRLTHLFMVSDAILIVGKHSKSFTVVNVSEKLNVRWPVSCEWFSDLQSIL